LGEVVSLITFLGVSMKRLSFLLIFILLFETLYCEQKIDINDLTKMSLLGLMNIKITTAGKTSEKISDIPASVVIITRDEISRYGYQTLTEILENTLGMYAINDYNVLGTDFGIRGHKSARANENIVFLVNGIKQTNDVYKSNPLNLISVPVEAIDRIEIVRGPMSVIYGSGAFFGAINIITDDSDEKLSIASTSIGSFNKKKAFVRVEDKLANLHVSVNGSVYNDDGLEIHYKDIAKTIPAIHDGTSSNEMAKNETYFNISGSTESFYFNMSYSNTINNPFVNYPLSKNAPAKLVGNAAAIGYKTDISKTVSIDGKISFLSYQEEVISDYYDDNFYTHYELFKSNTYESEINSFIKPNEDIDITLGLFYRYSPETSIRIHAPSEGMPGVLAEIPDGQANQALFTQINYRPFHKLQFTGGVRLEDKRDYDIDLVFNSGPDPWLEASKTVKENKIQVVPRIAAIYQVNDDHYFKFLYGEAIKYASFHLSITSLYMPNQKLLQPENIQTFEINYYGKLNPKISTNISLFQNRMNNLISRISGVDENGSYYQVDMNKGELITNGIEASLSMQPIEKFTLKFSGQYQKTENLKNEDVMPSFSPDVLGYMQASYLYSKNIVLALTGRYVGDIKSDWDVSRYDNNPNSVNNGYIGSDIDGYFSFSTNIRFQKLLNYNLFVNFKISNIFDSNYYYPTTSEVNWADQGYPNPGRTFLVSLGKEF
jgi:outer membrane receptor for ferrienterochelin and colicins